MVRRNSVWSKAQSENPLLPKLEINKIFQFLRARGWVGEVRRVESRSGGTCWEYEGMGISQVVPGERLRDGGKGPEARGGFRAVGCRSPSEGGDQTGSKRP